MNESHHNILWESKTKINGRVHNLCEHRHSVGPRLPPEVEGLGRNLCSDIGPGQEHSLPLKYCCFHYLKHLPHLTKAPKLLIISVPAKK